MGDFATGFVTGFANTLADGVNERNKIASDYFQKQYELATTVGLENHRKVESQVDVSVKTAKQLQQMGVPKDIIMAVASQDPMGLADFYSEIAAAQEAGVPIDEQFFNDFVTVSADFKAPEEDFATFFRKALRPVSSAAAADPESFNRDRKGGIFGALFGADPYGRANRKLDETIVIDGMSASELARLGKNYTPAGIEGAPTVSFDYGATRKPKGGSELSVSETTAINKEIEETATRIWSEGGGEMSREDARTQATEEIKKRYGHLPEVLRYLGGSTEEADPNAITVEELPPTGQELEGAGIGGIEPAPAPAPGAAPTAAPLPEAIAPAETPATGPVASPAATETAPEQGWNPIDPERENLFAISIKGLQLTWQSNNSDGTVTYVDNNGESYNFDPAEVRTFVKQFGNDFN